MYLNRYRPIGGEYKNCKSGFRIQNRCTRTRKTAIFRLRWQYNHRANGVRVQYGALFLISMFVYVLA